MCVKSVHYNCQQANLKLKVVLKVTESQWVWYFEAYRMCDAELEPSICLTAGCVHRKFPNRSCQIRQAWNMHFMESLVDRMWMITSSLREDIGRVGFCCNCKSPSFKSEIWNYQFLHFRSDRRSEPIIIVFWSPVYISETGGLQR